MTSCTPTIVWQAESWLALISEFRLDSLTPLFAFISNLIVEGTLLFAITIGYWFISKKIFYRVGILSLFSLGMNIFLKGIFMECRPAGVSHLATANGYSFPSGHSQASSALFGSIAQAVKSKWLILLLLTVPFLVALSRVYLGVHYVHDVIAGLAIGFAIVLIPWPTAWLTRLNLITQIVIMLSIVLIWSWLINSPTGKAYKYTAFLFGFWLGGQLEQRYLSFKLKDSAIRLLQGALGIGVVYLIWKGPTPLLNFLGWSHPAFHFTQFTLLGIWITYLAPWCFIRIQKK